MRQPLAIIGMSPGNSYFKDYEVTFLLKESIDRFGKCAVMVADVPAISTYLAMGYAPARARNKAIPKGNNLKNRTRRLAKSLGYSEEKVRIVDWAEEIENNPRYLVHYQSVLDKFNSSAPFAESVRRTCRAVVENSEKELKHNETAADFASHYLLSELAFMEFAPEFFEAKRVCYLYHRNWPVFEDYIAGRHDGIQKPHLDFLLLEAPYETFEKVHGVVQSVGESLHDTYSRVMQSGVLRAAYLDYPPVFWKSDGEFKGIFYEIICGFAQSHSLKLEWVEETGYGVVIDGLTEGRFDIFGSAAWPTPERHKRAALSRPIYYSDVGVWVRADSKFVEKDWISLNDSNCKIAVTEGDISHEICLTDFVFAKWIRAPQLGKVKALLEFVADGRADATLAEKITYDAYSSNLLSKLVNIAQQKPIRRYPNSFLVGKNQNDFLDLLNAYIDHIENSELIAEILNRYTSGQSGIYLKPRV
jgi:tRNA-dependent cyclodipeptide synthase